MAKEIVLANDRGVTLVDDDDYEWLSSMSWQISPRTTSWGEVVYSVHRAFPKPGGGQRTVSMHRFIMGEPKGLLVDHIDHNSLNNVRSNLRVATPAQNQMNKRSRPGKFKGVHHNYTSPEALAWRATIQINGKSIHLGSYPTQIEAAQAYDYAATLTQGEFACLNLKDNPATESVISTVLFNLVRQGVELPVKF